MTPNGLKRFCTFLGGMVILLWLIAGVQASSHFFADSQSQLESWSTLVDSSVLTLAMLLSALTALLLLVKKEKNLFLIFIILFLISVGLRLLTRWLYL